MAPPPGYAAYSGPDFRGGGLRRIKGFAVAIAILLAVTVLGQIITIVTRGAARDSARDFIEGRISEDAYNNEILASSGGGLLAGAATLAIFVLSIIWLYRIVSNHQNLGRHVSWSPGWAIGGWFLPPCIYIIPFLIVRESFRASDPASPPGTETWRSGPENPLPWIWLIAYSVLPIVTTIAFGFSVLSSFSGDMEDMAETMIDTSSASVVVSALVGVLGAAAWGLLVWTLTKRHTQLTGEAPAR